MPILGSLKKNSALVSKVFLAGVAFGVFLISPSKLSAFSTNMSASVVIGQPDFLSTSSNQGGGSPAANTIKTGAINMIASNGQKLVVADAGNSRVLIFNTIPTTNNASADVVIGQPDFSSSTVNQGGVGANGAAANTLNNPNGVFLDGNRLFISDGNNSRVLIYNSIPTTNNASADIVIGQANMNARVGAIAANRFTNSRDVYYDASSGKLFISGGSTDHRVLIYNQVPTSNGASADVVVGQVDFTHGSANQGGSVGANTLNLIRGVIVANGKLIIGDGANNRILIYNSIPTTNNASADIVIGQANMTSSSANQGGSVAANTFNAPGAPMYDGKRLFAVDLSNNRVLIYNSIPTTNNASADVVLGQSSFTGSSTNQAGSANANTFSAPNNIYYSNNQLFVADRDNARILVFNNIINNPGVSLDGPAENLGNGLIRLRGNSSVATPYVMSSVEYAVNGGSFSVATPTDGSFDSSSEAFFFDLDPTLNQPRDEQGQLIGGYTARVRGITNNADVTDRLFFFSPFEVHTPLSPSVSLNSTPTFDFSVNQNRTVMRNNLQKYQIQVKQGTGSWTTLIDEIPIDFASVKGSDQNLQKSVYEGLATNNGVFETNTFLATYTDNSSRIMVHSKSTTLSGGYQWKVVAIDKTGHGQETNPRILYVLNAAGSLSNDTFPLALLSLTGVGNPHLSTSSRIGAKTSYTTLSRTPTFFGIAWSGAAVTLTLTPSSCTTADCTKTYTTTAQNSRFGLTIPAGDLKPGKYSTSLSVNLGDQFNQIPVFTLVIR